jgi:hypothetical protein
LNALTAHAIVRLLSSDPARRLPSVSSRWRKFCSNGDGPKALRMISGATSAQDFTTEQAAVAEDGVPGNGAEFGVENCARAGATNTISDETASTQTVVILNITLGLYRSFHVGFHKAN